MDFLLHLIAALWIAGSVTATRDPSYPGLLFLMAGYYALGRGVAGALAASALRPGADPGAALRRLRAALGMHRLLALPAAWFAAGPGGWGSVVAAAGAEGGEAALLFTGLAPYLLLRVLGAAATHPAQRRVGLAEGSFVRSFGRSARLAGLVLLPVVLAAVFFGGAVAAAAAGVPGFRELDHLAGRFDIVRGLLTVTGLALTFLAAPRLAMIALGARPMPPGPLRARLEAYAARVGLRYHDLYVWRTGGTMPNAAVLGVGGPFRCVLFTDAILDQFEPDEVEAVFAHEAGHALHHHLPLFFLFTVAFMLALFSAPRLVPAAWEPWLAGDEVVAGLAAMGALLLYFGVVFGFVSRRLEQQADVHGLLTTGLDDGQGPREVLRDPARHPFLRSVAAGAAEPGEHPFVRSLDRIAAASGGIREITGWRHFSIADRVAFLRAFAVDGGVRAAYRRRIRGVVVGMMAGFAVFAAVAAADLPAQWAGPHPAVAVERAAAALARGDTSVAMWWIGQGARGADARGLTLSGAPRRRAGGRPVLALAALEFAQRAAPGPEIPGGTPPAEERARAAQIEALVLLADGRDGDAVRAAEDAVRLVASMDPPRGDRSTRTLDARRAEALLVWGDMLRAHFRPRAAAEAWARAAAAARSAGAAGSRLLDAALRREAAGGP